MIANKDKMMAAYNLKARTDTVANIGRRFNMPTTSVYYMLNYFRHDYKNNFHIRHQILLGSSLGDGYLQELHRANGIDKYYKYRETHSLKEKEYAVWKYLMLDDWTDNTKPTMKNKNSNNKYEALEFYTNANASDKIKEYYNMTKAEVIQEIDIYGLLILLLDDGWYSNHSKEGNFCIAQTLLTDAERLMLVEKFNQYSIKANIIGKRKDISISSRYNYILYAHLHNMFFTTDIDVIHKKFGAVSKNIKKRLQ